MLKRRDATVRHGRRKDFFQEGPVVDFPGITKKNIRRELKWQNFILTTSIQLHMSLLLPHSYIKA